MHSRPVPWLGRIGIRKNPVLQSLNDVPWDPYHSERTVEDLAVLLAPTLGLNGQESAPLPALWDKCDLVQ